MKKTEDTLISPFEGEIVYLRAIEQSDLPMIMKYWNNFEMRIGLGNCIPESSLQREEWIREVNEKAKRREGYTFAIVNKKTEEFLGTCALNRIRSTSRNTSMSVVIHNPENWSKGYGTDAVKCLLKIAFNILNLHRIELHVYDFLTSAIHVYEKLGFKKTGVRREASYINGKYVDDIVMDILDHEYYDR